MISDDHTKLQFLTIIREFQKRKSKSVFERLESTF